MRRFIICTGLFYGFLAALGAAILLVTPVMAAYYTTISVTESNGTSYDMLPVAASMDVDYLADNNFIEADGRDVRVKTIGGADVPFMLADDRVLFAGEIDNDITNQFRLSTGNSLLSNFNIVIGNNGYITTADHANLEPSNNFEIEYDGYLDLSTTTSAPGVATSASSKEDSETGSATVSLPSGIEADDLLIMIFSGYASGGGNPAITWPANWIELHQGTTSSLVRAAAYKIATGGEGSTVAVTTSQNCRSSHITYRIPDYYGVPELATTSGADSNPNSPSLSTSWGDIGTTLWITAFAAKDGATRTISSYPTNYDDDQIYIQSNGYTSCGAATRQLSATSEDPPAFTMSAVLDYWRAYTIAVQQNQTILVTKGADFRIYSLQASTVSGAILGGTVKTVTATGVATGDYNLKVGADATDLYIKIDDSTEDSETLSGATVADNSNGWIIWPVYLNYYKLTTASTLRLTYQPDDIITGTTLPNAEAAGTYDGTITYGSNPAGIAVTTSGLQTTAASYPTEPADSADIIRPTAPDLFDVNLERLQANPLQPIVLLLATGLNLTERLVWLAGAFVILFILVILILDKSDGQLSFMFFGAAGYCLIVYFLGIFPMWTIVVFAIAGIASLVYERVIAL